MTADTTTDEERGYARAEADFIAFLEKQMNMRHPMDPNRVTYDGLISAVYEGDMRGASDE